MIQYSEAAARVREQLEANLPIVPADAAELLEDYEALTVAYLRIMRIQQEE